MLQKKSILGGIKWKIKIAKRFLKHEWQRINGFNPYNVKPGGMCPVQADGILKDGKWYYFRARGTTASLIIHLSEEDFGNEPYVFYRELKYGKTFEAGYMAKEDAIRLATVWLNEYFEYQQTLKLKFKK